MVERYKILSRLTGISREFFLLTERWTLDDWKKIRDETYYEMMSTYGSNSREFQEFKMKRILNS